MLRDTLGEQGELVRRSVISDYLPELDLSGLLRILGRQWLLILLCALVTGVLGYAYVATAKKSYVSTVQIMLEPRGAAKTDASTPSTLDRQIDPGYVESQVEFIKSASVAARVVKQLGLDKPGAVPSSPPSLGSRLKQKVTSLFKATPKPAAPKTEAEQAAAREADTVGDLESATKAKRLGVTYIIEVSFTSTSPDLAYTTAQAIASAYIAEQVGMMKQASDQTNAWLVSQVAEAKKSVINDGLAVEAFRAEHNLQGTSHGPILDQQIAELTVQLSQSGTATAEAKARADRLHRLDTNNISDDLASGSLNNDVLNRLRLDYTNLVTKYAGLSARYGSKVQAVADARSQMRSVERAMQIELKRMVQLSESEYHITAAREAALQGQLQKLKDQNQDAAQAEARLQGLQATLQISRATYDSLLQRSVDLSQAQSFPISAAKIISPATVPQGPSAPKANLILLAAILAGLGLGFVLAVVREGAYALQLRRRAFSDSF